METDTDPTKVVPPAQTSLSPYLISLIDEVPGDDGWWRQSGRETYLILAERLKKHGVSDNEVGSILGSAYGAAASEYGG